MGGNSTRRMRVFRRWMEKMGIECSDALELVDSGEEGVWVRALRHLREGDLVATIPKESCLSTRTSAVGQIIDAVGLEGVLALSFALMYERSLSHASSWAGYLQLLPAREDLPIVWTPDEVDRLLLGTELHRVVKEDKKLLCKDWRECIRPLLTENPKLNPTYFGLEDYIAARTLVASRSFQIDDFYGYGMVPLADLFNHKTGDEDVHFTSVCSVSNYDDNSPEAVIDDDDGDGMSTNHVSDRVVFDDSATDDRSAVSDVDTSSSEGDPAKLEMIIVQDVSAGAEVFNTYGSMGNAALLHRYGFTEPENPLDIINIDIQLVNELSRQMFSSRHFRRRLSLWRKLHYSGCISQMSEYFEVTSDGEPQLELLVLLYILHLEEDAYEILDKMVHSFEGSGDDASRLIMSTKAKSIQSPDLPECMSEFLLTEKVCHALVSLANARESCYGVDTLEDDWNKLRGCCCVKDRKLYHSLVLRISERTILCRLREYASISGNAKRKKLKAASS